MISTSIDMFGGVLSLGTVRAGPVQFDTPVWLLLAPALWAATLLIARRSLSGLSGRVRWTAVGVRLAVIGLLAGAMAEPQWRRESKDVSVTFVLDASRSIPPGLQTEVDQYVAASRDTAVERAGGREDRLGVVTAAKDAYVQTLPSRLARQVERITVGAEDGTNLAQGLRLAMAVLPPDAANRIVIASDGNETAGSLLQAAESAKAAGVPIDVLPLRYRYESEVIVDKLVTPATARRGETLSLRVLLNATRPTEGLLTVTMNGEAVDLDPDRPGNAAAVELRAGPNVLSVPVTAQTSGPQRFEAIYEPIRQPGAPAGDQLAENNRALAVTFVTGEGRVLVLAESTEDSAALVEGLRAAKLEVEVMPAERAPQDLTAMNAYDAIVLMNQPSYNFTIKQQEDLKQYVHDSGGGLVVVGGPESFGAGGWIGSPLEDALPVRLDPPQKRQMPRGAMVILVHSVEIPQGVFWGKKVCDVAVDALSRLDLIGIVEFNGMGTVWVHELQQVGDRSLVKQRINTLQFGDMPDFGPSVKMAYDALSAADAGQKHLMIISDGDPQPPSQALLRRYVDAKITISAVGIGVHGVNEQRAMERLAKETGGRFYDVSGDIATLPQVFIKEAQTIRRSLIWEGTPFSPAVVGGAMETMRGIASVPPIGGYVVTADREGLALVTLRGKENDPVAAQWQHGLGKVVAFTSDAVARWSPAWVGWGGYRQFWEQHVRWAMRPGGSANVRIATENKGDETVIIVDALDAAGERLNFANFAGRLALPDGEGQDVSLRQIGPGRYEGRVRTERAGAYVATLKYVAPGKDGQPVQGTVQAAITRPFADEYRALEDNTPLLRQVAEMTGGRVLNFDATRDDVWNADTLRFPVATRPIWLATALAALALFLVDVGVRRVRIDPAAVVRRVAGVFKTGTRAAGTEVAGLKAAKDKARAGMAQRGDGSATRAETVAAPTAGVKFEAAPARPGASRDVAPGDVALGGPDAKPPQRTRAADAPAPGAPAGDEGMSALLKAKKRAREGMDDGDQKG